MAEPIKALTQPQAAALLGVTPRRLRQIELEDAAVARELTEAGKPQGYPAEAFGRWLRARWIAEVGADKGGEVYDKQVEHARLLHHQANIAALDEDVKRKTLIPEQVVLERWQGILANVRARLLAIPSQLAATCADSPRQDVEQKAADLVHQALDELREPEY